MSYYKRVLGIPLTDTDRYERVAAAVVLAKRKELTNETMDKFNFDEAKRFGIDTTAIYKARPDLAKKLKMTKEEVMNKITPGKFWEDVQKEALQDPEIALRSVLDVKRFNRMSQNLKPDYKRELKNTLLTMPLAPIPLTPNQQNNLNTALHALQYRAEWQV